MHVQPQKFVKNEWMQFARTMIRIQKVPVCKKFLGFPSFPSNFLIPLRCYVGKRFCLAAKIDFKSVLNLCLVPIFKRKIGCFSLSHFKINPAKELLSDKIPFGSKIWLQNCLIGVYPFSPLRMANSYTGYILETSGHKCVHTPTEWVYKNTYL